MTDNHQRSRPIAPRRRVGAIGGACAITLLVGCSGTAPEQPEPSSLSALPGPSPSGSVGAALDAAAVEDLLWSDLQGEQYFGWDQATWQEAKDAALALPWQMISAAGVQQAVACTGEGAPTVVYIDGWDAPAAANWALAATEQAQTNRVCAFDRPGSGLSPARRGAAPHSTPELHAQEMLAMLAALGEPGPYLLVPWSYGALVARAAATQQPEQVAGMVLVEGVSPLMSGLDEPRNDENGIVDTDTIASTVGSGPDMGEKPVIVLTAGDDGPEADAEAVAEWAELQRQAATISDNAVHAIVEESDHSIPQRNPAAVVAATTAVSDSVLAGNAPLPECPEALVAAGATCVTP